MNDKNEALRSLYEITGNITDHNTLLVSLAELETLRAGYEAARLEIESLKAQLAEHADELAVAYMCGASREKDLAAPQPGATCAALPYKQALGSTNCMQCCVSYMMGLPLENVPDFATDGGWERFSDFAEMQGYVAVMLPGNREYESDYLASGTTARGTSHMVVMNDGKLVHDPHPSNAGLVDVQCVWLLAKRASPTQGQQDEHTAFEASAKTYTSNVSFERDASDYVDMTASLLWHGWKLRASHAQAPAQSEVVPECHYGPLRDADAEWVKQLSVYATLPRATDTQQAPAEQPGAYAALERLEYYESQDDSLLLCASDLQHSAIYDNHVEMQSCMRAVAARIAALVHAAPTTQPAAPQAAGKAVHQFRKQYCADWYDGRANHGDSGGPYEERTLYTVPQPAAQGDPLDAARYRFLAAHCRSTSEHWGGRWSIIVDGPAPKSHDSEDYFDAAIDAARKEKS